MSTKQLLLDLYGPLLTYGQLAHILGRTPAALRTNLCRKESPSGQLLSQAKVRIGHRVYFKVERIAQILDGQEVS